MLRHELNPDRRVRIASIVAPLLMLSAAVVFAQDVKKATPSAGEVAAPAAVAPAKSGPAAPDAVGPQVALPNAPAIKKPAPSPMVAEMIALLATQDQKLADLGARQGKARTNEEALAVQREIQDLKQGTEISLLRIQATYARREGRVQDADRLEATIRDLVSPPKLNSASARPAPVRTDQPR